MSIEERQQGITHNGSRLCVVPMLKLTQNLIKGTKDGKFRNI